MLNEDLIIKNKVAESGLITINLEEYYHHGERILIDIKQWLFQELILKEKDFREQLKKHDWNQYLDKNVAFTCSSDAIIPTWAYMLLATHLESFAHRYVFGNLDVLETILFQDALNQVDFSSYKDARVIIKGCSHLPVPVSAYVEITNRLMPFAKSIMYGEACSNVPIWKNRPTNSIT